MDETFACSKHWQKPSLTAKGVHLRSEQGSVSLEKHVEENQGASIEFETVAGSFLKQIQKGPIERPERNVIHAKFLEQLKKQRQMAGVKTENNKMEDSTKANGINLVPSRAESPSEISPPPPRESTSKASGSEEPSSEQSAKAIVPARINLSLHEITALLDRLNNPQDQLRAVHVAGTNGKGSVCAYITSSLICSNLKVGQFISPHLIDRWDCVTINGEVISADEFLKIEHEIKEISKENDIEASSFEVLTACAFTYFSREKVDVAVIETGMGGLLDATNVISSPLVSIITSISIDHTDYLGRTLDDIAKHKAGIIKPGCPVVIAPQPPHIASILSETAKAIDVPIYTASGYWRTPAHTRYMVEHVRFDYSDRQSSPILSVVPGINGPEQSSNVACAVKALSILRETFPQITETAVQNGVARATLPGRMEWIRWEGDKVQPMLLDGAHNPASCTALGQYIDGLRRDGSVYWVVAMSAGRDIGSCLDKFLRKGDMIACVEFGQVDGMEWVRPVAAEEIANHSRVLIGDKGKVEIFGSNVSEAINWAALEARENRGMLVGTGSLYLVGHIHRILRTTQHADPHDG